MREISYVKAINETLHQMMGKGESSCLGIAISRDLKILTDDKDVISHLLKLWMS